MKLQVSNNVDQNHFSEFLPHHRLLNREASTVDVWVIPWALLEYCKTEKFNEQKGLTFLEFWHDYVQKV